MSNKSRKSAAATSASAAPPASSVKADNATPPLSHTLGYHSFPDASLAPLRSQLLEWYDRSRRKLPWRGDPVDASTSDAAASFGAREKKARRLEENATQLKSMLQTPTETGSAPEAVTAAAPADALPAASSSPSSSAPVAVSAYGTWVSEVMLQQTRVETVLGYWQRWMDRFPTPAALAAASLDEVRAMWAGLGFYRRAAMLWQGARFVQEKLGGEMPRSVEGLRAIPGIGPYTAGAIASIAFNIPTPLVDGNVIRVLSRLRALEVDPKARAMQPVMWSLVARLVHPTRPGDMNQALMELGATICTPLAPKCAECPVRHHCYANREVQQQRRPCATDEQEQSESGGGGVTPIVIDIESLELPSSSPASSPAASSSKPSSKSPADPFHDLSAPCTFCAPRSSPPSSVTAYPAKASKKAPLEQQLQVCVVTRKQEGEEELFLLLRRPAEGLLANQWEFPGVIVPADCDESARHARLCEMLARQFGIDSTTLALHLAHPSQLGSITHVFSHRRHVMGVTRASLTIDSTMQHAAADRMLQADEGTAAEKKTKSKSAAKPAGKKRKQTPNNDADSDSDDDASDADVQAESSDLSTPRSYRWVPLASLQADHKASGGSELGLSSGVRKIVQLLTTEPRGARQGKIKMARKATTATETADAENDPDVELLAADGDGEEQKDSAAASKKQKPASARKVKAQTAKPAASDASAAQPTLSSFFKPA